MTDHDLMDQFIKTNRSYKRTVHRKLDEVGMHAGQPFVLLDVRAHTGVFQKELSINRRVQPATVTNMLARMEKAGLIQRRHDEADQRRVKVYITKEGDEACKVAESILSGVETGALAGFTDAEREQLLALLKKLEENFGRME